MVTVHAKEPNACTLEEIADFSRLVLEGGEVGVATLASGIERARALAFLMDDLIVVGVAGLKRPLAPYRKKISDLSTIELPEQDMPFEIGWVYVRECMRGGKSKMLCQALLAHGVGRGVFATSRSDNQPMHATLAALGFERRGAQWPSAQNQAHLALFTRKALSA